MPQEITFYASGKRSFQDRKELQIVNFDFPVVECVFGPLR
jgi:hypothetical protein